MKVLSKTHYQYIMNMINDGKSLKSIKAYCLGAGFNVNDILSPVKIGDYKISITYRRKTTYFNIFI